jgi:hypothetical protein
MLLPVLVVSSMGVSLAASGVVQAVRFVVVDDDIMVVELPPSDGVVATSIVVVSLGVVVTVAIVSLGVVVATVSLVVVVAIVSLGVVVAIVHVRC